MAGEEPISGETGKIFQHENHETPAPSVGDRTLGEGDSNKRQKITGIAGAVIRTLEEKAIIEERPLKDETDETTLKDQTIIEESESVSVQSGRTGLVNDGPHETSTMDSGASAKHKSLSLKSDVDSEDATASMRETLRTNLGSRSGRKPWTVPTMKPKVGPQDFEDPISDAFWKDIWVASALHNVSASSWASITNNNMLCADQPRRLRYTGRFSMPSLTILSLLGNNTKSLWRTTNVLTNPYVCPLLCVCINADKIVRQTRNRDSSPTEPISQNPSESGEERTAHESQPAEPQNMNSESSKGGENALSDSSLKDLSIMTKQNEELYNQRRSSKSSEPFEKWEREEMEKLLSQLNGQLGMYRLFWSLGR
jgi:phospholipase D1/2